MLDDAGSVVGLAAPTLPDEDARVRAVRGLGLHGSPPQERFDRVARIAARVFDAPIALVTVVDESEQWAVSCLGLPNQEMPRAESFCSHAIGSDAPLVVRDTRLDPRFVHNPLVTGPPGIRFYAGRPIRTASGFAVGTLCVLDVVPRQFSQADIATLTDLARLIEVELNAAELSIALDARRAAELRLRAVKDSAAEGIVTVDDLGRVGYANQAALRLLGRLHDDAVGRPLREVLEELGGADATSVVLSKGPTQSGEIELRRPDASGALTVAYTSRSIAPPGEGTVVVFRDVSAERAVEGMRERVIATVSHELRTPLTAVIGYLEGLSEGDAGDLSDAQRTYVDGALRNAMRLRELTDDLLAVRPIAADARTDLRSVIEDLEITLQSTCEGRQVRVLVDVAVALEVRGEERRLRQVIGNLLSNALKFSPEGGTVTVRGWAGDEAVVEVVDEGPGIPAAELPHVGERFFRASTSGAVPGTGLGVAIAREIVSQHGGSLEFESPASGGTVARLRLPRAPTA